MEDVVVWDWALGPQPMSFRPTLSCFGNASRGIRVGVGWGVGVVCFADGPFLPFPPSAQPLVHPLPSQMCPREALSP